VSTTIDPTLMGPGMEATTLRVVGSTILMLLLYPAFET
jgi:hypothetical protein